MRSWGNVSHGSDTLFSNDNDWESSLVFNNTKTNSTGKEIYNFNQASSLGLGQPVSWAEDCTGMLCADICERIIWAIFEYTKLHQHFDPEGSLQANATLGDAALYNTSREVSI